MAELSREQSGLRLYGVVATLVVAALVALGWGMQLRDSNHGIVLLVAGGLGIALATIAVFVRAWLGPLFAALVIAGGGVVAAGIIESNITVVALGVTGLIVIGASGAVVGALSVPASSGAPASRSDDGPILSLLDEINANVMLSDNARRVLFRERELSMLRDVIREDIRTHQYNAAIKLCDDLVEYFGQREEAEEFRTAIERAREDDRGAQIQAAVDELDQSMQVGDFSKAHLLAERIRRLYPEAPVTRDLETRLEEGREEFKSSLEAAFVAAAEADDVERAMTLLRRLDRYMSRDEAERLAPAAKRVLEQHKHGLGEQFRSAVGAHQWVHAAEIGQIIVEEFPSSKMAGEVQSMMAMIAQRATESAAGG